MLSKYMNVWILLINKKIYNYIMISIIQWIIFLCIIYYFNKYILPLLILTYIIYLYTFPSKYGKPNGFNSEYIEESLMYFVMGITMTPISFIAGVFGMPTIDYPTGP